MSGTTTIELDLRQTPSVASRRGRVLAVGQMTADTNVRLDTRLSLGDQVTGVARKGPGGTAAIVAHNAAITGGGATFAGHVGRDEGGKRGLERLRDAGVTVGSLIETDFSAEVIVLVEPDGERTMVASGVEPEWGELALEARPDDVVFFEDWHLLNKRAADGYLDLIGRVASLGALVAVDVCSARANGRSLRRHLASAGVSLVLANEREAHAYGFLSEPPVSMVIVHASAQPTTVVDHGHVTEVPVEPAPVLDSTGAGDTFAAAALVALSRGADLVSATVEGHRLAREVIAVEGPLLPVHRPIAVGA